MESVRIDKWLWAARFYKTRSIAKESLLSGKVKVSGHNPKPSYQVKVGDQLRIRRGNDLFQVIVKGMSDKRLSAPLAQALYEETEASRLARERQKEERLAAPDTQHRPDKKQRRQLRDFKSF